MDGVKWYHIFIFVPAFIVLRIWEGIKTLLGRCKASDCNKRAKSKSDYCAEHS